MATTSTSRSKTRLSYIPAEELAAVNVAIKRHSITSPDHVTPLQRNIDDPLYISPLIHIRKGKDTSITLKGIFDRDDILVNPEERFLPTEADRSKSQSQETTASWCSRHYSLRRKTKSRSRSRSAEKSELKVQDKENAGEKDKKNKSGENKQNKISEQEEERSADIQYRDRPSSRERDDIRCKRRSGTPLRPGEYRPPSRRVESLSDECHRPSTSRKMSRSPRRSTSRGRERQISTGCRQLKAERDRITVREKERSTDKQYTDRPHNMEQDDKRYRRRSRTPLRPNKYRPSYTQTSSRCRSSSRDRDYNRYRTHSRRIRSLSKEYHRPSTSRKTNRSSSRFTSHSRERQKSSGYKQFKTSRSRSPQKSTKSYYETTDHCCSRGSSRRSRSRSHSKSAESNNSTKVQDRGIDENNRRRLEEWERIPEQEKEKNADIQHKDRPCSRERDGICDKRRSRTSSTCRSSSRYIFIQRRSRSLSVVCHRPSSSRRMSRKRQISPECEHSRVRRSRSPRNYYDDKRKKKLSSGYTDSAKRSQSPSFSGRCERYLSSCVKRHSQSPSRYNRKPSTSRCRFCYRDQRRSSRSPIHHRRSRSPNRSTSYCFHYDPGYAYGYMIGYPE